MRDLTMRAAVVTLCGMAGLASAAPTPIGHATSPMLSAQQRAALEQHLEAALFAALPTDQQALILGIADQGEARRHANAGLSVCFAPGTPDETIRSFHQLINAFQPRFQPGTRWEATALDPTSTGVANTPTTITYSFVPDGTPLPSGVGEPAEPSSLFAWMNSLYGSPAVWQPILDSLFQRWGQVAGLNYVYEANDDGAELPQNGGVAGVRGDVRISAHVIDGNGGILAYNYFPQAGDMVIDANDSFYANLGGDSLRLRNVLQHEHGHGLGMFHVCPTSQTKLMEPFISTLYDGVRHDDIRHAQAKYGDRREPNDSIASASVLGSIVSATSVGDVPPPAVAFASTLSINAGDGATTGDVDFFTFTVPSVTVLDIGVNPVGLQYDDSPQACNQNAGSCCFGSFTDSLVVANLNVELLNTSGVLLASGASALAGQVETLRVRLTPGQTYVVRVFADGPVDEPQLYTLSLAPTNAPLIVTLTSPLPFPSVVPPASPVQVITRISNGLQTLNAPSPVLRYRETPTASPVAIPMVFFAPDTYRAMLPGFACGASPSFVVEATSTTGTLVSLAGPTYSIGGTQTLLFETFEAANVGWTVGPDTATAGAWVLDDPIGTAAQPEEDTTPGPGVNCWFTGQGSAGGAVGEADVDGGRTILTSPVISLAGITNATVSYRRWFSNSAGASPFQDFFRVEASGDNGATWIAAETLGPGASTDPLVQGGWLPGSFSLAAIGLGGASSVRVRFIAEDVAPGSIIEAAIDDFRIEGVGCSAGAVCDSIDFNRDTLFPDSGDLDDFVAVLAGGPSACSTFPTPGCNDVDFNNDGFSPDALDLDAFLSRLGGGPCL
jgi:hypothetical protein